MRVTDVRHWQWLLISLLVGGACGGVRQSASDDIEDRLDRHGKLIADPKRFEVALLTKVRSQPLLKDVVVYPYWIPRREGQGNGREDGGRLVHVVSGKYWDGKAKKEGGQTVARWVPASFLAQVPFEPRLALPGGDGAPAKFASVLEYLAFLERKEGIRYRYAWWWWAAEPLFVWTAGSIVLVGVLWPMLINLLTFGTLLRPREERGRSLWGVRSATQPKPVRAATASVSLDELEAELESRLADDAKSPEPARAAPAIRQLSNAPLLPAAEGPKEVTEYNARDEDYYPTAARATPRGHPDGSGAGGRKR